MDVLGTLPIWAQVLIAFLVAGVMIVLNLGWLLQARSWLERQKQARAGGTSTPTASTRPKRDRV